jgi:hypothetical protein
LFVLLSAAAVGSVCAQGNTAANSVVYRCPGPPVLYTDAITPQEAKDKKCRTIEGAPITIVQAPRPRTQAASGANGARSKEDSRVDPSAQRGRDNEARQILEAELKREEAKLAGLQQDYKGGEPERRGDERNYAKYLERVAEMKASIARKEEDIAAIKRELAKLPQ